MDKQKSWLKATMLDILSSFHEQSLSLAALFPMQRQKHLEMRNNADRGGSAHTIASNYNVAI